MLRRILQSCLQSLLLGPEYRLTKRASIDCPINRIPVTVSFIPSIWIEMRLPARTQVWLGPNRYHHNHHSCLVRHPAHCGLQTEAGRNFPRCPTLVLVAVHPTPCRANRPAEMCTLKMCPAVLVSPCTHLPLPRFPEIIHPRLIASRLFEVCYTIRQLVV